MPTYFLELPILSIIQIEKALYEKKKIYLWYADKKGHKIRFDIELLTETAAAEVLAKIRFILFARKSK